MRIGADLHENQLFIEKRCFRPNLVISGPPRPQKWIRLEILHWKMVSGGLEVKIEVISKIIEPKLKILFSGVEFRAGSIFEVWKVQK